MGQSLVSIITPVLHRVQAMRACHASVASWTYRPIEQII